MMKNKFFMLGLGALLALTMVISGCNRNTGNGGDELEGSITINGSTSVAPVVQVLAEEFMALHKNVQIHVQSTGSSAGIRAAQENTSEIGMTSRALKAEEKTVKEFTLAKDAIVIVVNKANPVSAITLEQIRKIYLGEITNWSELGGADVPIIVVTRETGSGTRGAFEDIVMNKQEIMASAIVQGSTGAVRTAVENDPNAIGYVSLAALTDGVKGLAVDGVNASEATILNGTYKIARPFILMTHDTPEGLAKAFLDFCLSSEGQSLVREEGLVPAK
jgi:phosphate transport system substrate-binding protein